MISRALLLVLACSTAPGLRAQAGCDALHAWMDRARQGTLAAAVDSLDVLAVPVGPAESNARVIAGPMPGADAGLELVVVLHDSTGSRVPALRSGWLDWLGTCIRADESSWSVEERDVELEAEVPASKALGRFPSEAYIREDPERYGIRYAHPGSGAVVNVLTDPTAIAARSVEAGYAGPPVVLLIDITAGARQ